MSAFRERSTVLLIACLLLTAGLLTWPIVEAGGGTREDRFWSYVRAHAPSDALLYVSRRDALAYALTFCSFEPISNIEVRNWREFVDLVHDETLPKNVSARVRAEDRAIEAIFEGTYEFICPVTKHLPEHPRRDLVAGFPLPPGTVLDDDPTLGRPDDDGVLGPEPDDDFRHADYYPLQRMTLKDLAQFYESRIHAGDPWRDWSWCGSTGQGYEGDGETYVWEKDDLRLYLSWSKVVDDLVHSYGTRMIYVHTFSTEGIEDLRPCGDLSGED